MIVYSGLFSENYRSSSYLGATFSVVKFMYSSWQKCIGLHFGRFFHKLIWSPCVEYSPHEAFARIRFLSADQNKVARWFIFKPNPHLGYILGGLLISFLTIWYTCAHLPHFMAIWYSLGSSVIVCPFWYIVSRYIWQPWTRVTSKKGKKLSKKCRFQTFLSQAVQGFDFAKFLQFFQSNMLTILTQNAEISL
jgi:hypothetical protein